MKNFKALILSFLAVIIISLSGSYFTNLGVNSSWYESIKPGITPPDYVFPVVWTILYILIALSLYYSYSLTKNKKIVVYSFGINFILNILWTYLFFSLKNPLASFIEILILDLSIVQLLYVTYKIDKKPFLMLIPYLLWVLFASVLNYLMV